VEAARIATKYMTPVILLADGYMANASEPWLIPNIDDLEEMNVNFHSEQKDFYPFKRNDSTLARIWAIPGTKGLEHRIGGIEKSYSSGDISYDPENHQKMTETRKKKIDQIAKDIPLQKVSLGEEKGDLAVVGWGSTFGPINRSVQRAKERGMKVSHIHLRHIWPLPSNLNSLLNGFDKILVPEMNTGQLITLIRSQYLVPAVGLNKISGQPFKVSEINAAINEHLEN
jgi:2-oxoglutarate ferredoxin oxidoreductase subunit alpha